MSKHKEAEADHVFYHCNRCGGLTATEPDVVVTKHGDGQERREYWCALCVAAMKKKS